MLDYVAPELEDERGVDGQQPLPHELEYVPKGLQKLGDEGYSTFLPVGMRRGLRLRPFRNANASSTGAVEYEYGADTHTRKPNAFMWRSASAPV